MGSPFFRRAAGTFALLTALFGCAGGPASVKTGSTSAAAHAESLPRIDSTEWRCVRLVDAGGRHVDVTDRPPTLRIEPEGRASGFAGVNRYFADVTFFSVTHPPEPLRFGPVGATRMAGPPERMALEEAFTSMLGTVRSARVMSAPGGPLLVLASERGDCAFFERIGAD
jgi:heat shock protein HslJ